MPRRGKGAGGGDGINLTHAPVCFAASAGFVNLAGMDAQFDEIAPARLRSLPLFPIVESDAPPDPQRWASPPAVRLPAFLRLPPLKCIVRTAFWTCLCMALLFEIYGIYAEHLGRGLFVHGHHFVPKLHMRIEVRVNDVLSYYTNWGLAGSSILVAIWSRSLACAGLLLLVLLSFGISRF